MRQIGHLENHSSALTFSDALFVHGIENEVKPDDDGSWIVWVHAEERVPLAREMLSLYKKNPDHEKFHQAPEKAHELRRVEQREKKAYKKRMATASRAISGVFENKTGRFTLALIVISAAVALISGLGSNKGPISGLFITDYEIIGNRIRWRPGLTEVFQGEFWRLITPIFIHYGIFHILFNMLWLRALGSMIEWRQGALYFGILVVVIAAVSNLGQYFLTGPSFGGMSGVDYGLLGYVWIKGKYDPKFGVQLSNVIVQLMIVYFFLCLTGLFGPIANAAHGFGLATGMAWGYLSARR